MDLFAGGDSSSELHCAIVGRVFRLLYVTLLCACTSGQAPTRMHDQLPVIVYKTKGDYARLVPITMSMDKQRIVAYPDPSDLRISGQLPYPVTLREGYLLDRRGINRNTAFLSLTYEAYAELDSVPPLDTLYSLIIDHDPFTEMYHCGNWAQYDHPEKDLNRAISRGAIKQYPSAL